MFDWWDYFDLAQELILPYVIEDAMIKADSLKAALESL
jgi:hypothetical protein